MNKVWLVHLRRADGTDKFRIATTQKLAEKVAAELAQEDFDQFYSSEQVETNNREKVFKYKEAVEWKNPTEILNAYTALTEDFLDSPSISMEQIEVERQHRLK